MTPAEWRLFVDGMLAMLGESIYLCWLLPVLLSILHLLDSAFRFWRRRRKL
jgi:hypothetical protein